MGRRGAAHIRPSPHLERQHIVRPRASYTAREADDIANLAFIGGKTNRQISDKSPSQYFPGLLKKSGLPTFDAQCIPTNAELLGVENYKSFLLERRRLIAQRLNTFLGVTPP